jgi:DNA replication protein
MEFGRPLSGLEMERIMEFAKKYDSRRVIVALNEAASYDQRSLDYIERVLAAWKRKNLSIEDLENGKR